MSEYQYYEFLAIDRPLSADDMQWLRGLSTRATITATSFTNEYHWGSFHGDPWKMMERCFDLFVYYANWGSRRLMLRLPRGTINVENANLYAHEESVRVAEKEDFVILSLACHDDSGDWDGWTHNVGWMASLAPLRNDLLIGDLRCLYLSWLNEFSSVLEDDDLEPPVPPGLHSLTSSLQALVDFLGVDNALLEAAASRSAERQAEEPSDDALCDWIRSLKTSDKNDRLIRIALGHEPNPRGRLMRDFRTATRPPNESPDTGPRRTVAELRAAWFKQAEVNERRRKEQAEQERQRRAEAEATARRKHLETVASRIPAIWQEATACIEKRTSQGYVRAVELLTDLKDVAVAQNKTGVFEDRLHVLRSLHARKRGLINQLNQAGLTT